LEFTNAVARRAGLYPSDARRLVHAFEEVLLEHLAAGGSVRFHEGLGTFLAEQQSDTLKRAVREGKVPEHFYVGHPAPRDR
jgi:nucleoid DNA-binding protein